MNFASSDIRDDSRRDRERRNHAVNL